VARIGFGLLTLSSHYAVPEPSTVLALAAGSGLASSYVLWAGTYGGRLLRVALAHSGLASVQIGLMRLIGHEVPERYDFPLLARSPAEFWRRWNIWVGRWAQRYVFTPLAVAQARTWRKRAPLVGQGLAALATFTAIGLLHDAFFFCRDLSTAGTSQPWKWTATFVLFGLLFIAWLPLSGLLRGAGARGRPGIGAAAAPALRGFPSWLVFVHCLLLVIWAINPESSSGLTLVR
jgi:D-alanyl-lipoteichoic acid acyltransferase DltB (MBOAT superfamily)